MSITSSLEIRERIDGLDALAVDLGADFDKVAMEAVAGVEGAGKKAAEINQRIERLAVDRRILSRALDRSLNAEAAAIEAEAEAERQRHLKTAKAHAVALLDASKRADAAILSFVSVLDDIAREEAAVRHALGLARALPSDAIVGRHGLSGMALDALQRITDGRARFGGVKPVADVAAYAWASLLTRNDEVAR